jgi:multidrug resistance efflux pump
LKHLIIAASLTVCAAAVLAESATTNSATTQSTTQSTQPATQATTAADTISPTRGNLKPEILATGYFEPTDALEVRVRPEAYQGDLKIISAAARGASVKQGDVLLAIDPQQLNDQIKSAQDDLTNAKAAVDKAKSDVDLGEQSDDLAEKVQEREVANANASVKWFDDVDGKDVITNAEMTTKQAKGAVEDQQDELDQLKKMYKSEELTNATADIVVKRAVRNLELSKISEGQAEEHESKARQFDFDVARQKLLFAVEQQKQTLETLKATQALGAINRKTALDAANLALAKAQQKVDDLNKDLAAFTVKAPADGVVLYGQLTNGAWQNDDPNRLRVGEKINPGDVQMTFFVPGKLRLRAEIPENRIDWIKAGVTVGRVMPISLPAAATDATCGPIVAVGTPRDNGLQVMLTPFDLAKTDPQLVPGEKANLRIELPELKDVLLLPKSAVTDGRVKVRTSEDQEKWRDVVTGFSDDDQVQIVSGLSESDHIISAKDK